MIEEKNKIRDWLLDQKNSLDDCIRKAASSYYGLNNKTSNFSYDVNVCNNESYNLSRGKDLFYDRPGTAFSYSLWYQGRRINMLLPYFLDLIYDSRDRNKLEVFDLGAGTGAVQIALGLIVKGFDINGVKCPQIRVVNIDTSAIMLEYSRSYLWKAFDSQFEVKNLIQPSYSVNSWINNSDIRLYNPWIIASYLFDSSDNVEELVDDFKNLLEELQVEKIILLTSAQTKKVDLLNQVANSINENYSVQGVLKNPLFTGVMSKTYYTRKWLRENAGLNFGNTPMWNDSSFYGKIMTKKVTKLSLDFKEEQEVTEVDLYNPPIVMRREVELSESQMKASEDDGRPTIITGPAGCGKSIVITERVLTVVLKAIEENRINEIRILLTTFNKELKNYLLSWLKELFEREGLKYERTAKYDVGFKFEGSLDENITLMHFDIIPTRIWKEIEPETNPFFSDSLQFDNYHHRILDEVIDVVKKAAKITTKEYDNVLNPTYILDEYHRVIYGQEYWNKEEYYLGERRGRPKLRKEGSRRKLIWVTIQAYLKGMEQRKTSSVFTRRHKFLKKIQEENSIFRNLFSHIFVDEFQDCTQADYKIFYGLLSDNNNLVLAGDYAQAVHLGSSADIPRIDNREGERMRNRNSHSLVGSYRLPMNISRAIRPISQGLKDFSNEKVDVITPYKGSPPGIRPIFVKAESIEELAEKIIEIVDVYKPYSLLEEGQKIAILEKDNQLFRSLIVRRNNFAETDTILRLKGMEKNVVVWSTRIMIPDQEEINNFIYTIMTRTSCMLIIAICDEMCEPYKELIKQIPTDYVINWDQETKTYLDSYIYN